MAFWSGDKLKLHGRAIGLIDPFDDKQIDCSAYTLTLGPECFVTPNFGDEGARLKTALVAPNAVSAFGRALKPKGGEMVIPPGQFAFLLTEEFIKIPKSAMGFISLKSIVKWRGLINVSGFHVDPGFSGRLVYSVYNAGPSSIHLNRGDDLFLLWVADLDQDSSDEFSKISKPPLVDISSGLISDVDRPLHSLQSLSQKVESLDRELRLFYRVLTALAVIGGLIFAAWALMPDKKSELPSVEAIS